MLAVDLPSDTKARLEAIAKAKGQTVDEYVRELVLSAIEDAEDIADAEAVLAKLKSGQIGVTSSDEIAKEFLIDH